MVLCTHVWFGWKLYRASQDMDPDSEDETGYEYEVDEGKGTVSKGTALGYVSGVTMTA